MRRLRWKMYQGAREEATMAEIEVTRAAETDQAWEFDVTVREADGQSTHRMALSRADLADLRGEPGDPEGFVRDCFEFLLAREPKEAIMSRFDVRDIGRYFPEFREEISSPT
jgi:hypothetical protein